MGYGGKVAESRRARELRAESWTLADIACELGVSKSSVSVWVSDVEFIAKPRNRGHRSQTPHPMHLAKLAEIERCDVDGVESVATLSNRELSLIGTALYGGEGFKRDGVVGMANTDPACLRFFVTWLRDCFGLDERRLRVRLYLHHGLDLDAAERYWSEGLGIPITQFRKAYRAVADPTIRRSKHVHGCPSVTYSDSSLHRRVMGLVRALSSSVVLPG
jgi:transcriptional regulator with XRE-family HTH domain